MFVVWQYKMSHSYYSHYGRTGEQGGCYSSRRVSKPTVMWQTDCIKDLGTYYTKHLFTQTHLHIDSIGIYRLYSSICRLQRKGISNWVKLAFKYLAPASHCNAKTWWHTPTDTQRHASISTEQMNACILYLVCTLKRICRLKRLTTGLQARVLITEESLSDTEIHPMIQTMKAEKLCWYTNQESGAPAVTPPLPTDSISAPRSHAVLLVAITATARRNWTPAPRRRDRRKEGRKEGRIEEWVALLTSEDYRKEARCVFNTSPHRDGSDVMLQPRALFYHQITRTLLAELKENTLTLTMLDLLSFKCHQSCADF